MNSNNAIPHPPKIKAKYLQKAATSITEYKKNSDYLLSLCSYEFLIISCSLSIRSSELWNKYYIFIDFHGLFSDRTKKDLFDKTYKINLSSELRMRLAHNQSRINEIKSTITSFLETKYVEKHRDILLKLVHHCNKKTEVDVEEMSAFLTCPDGILEADVLIPIKKRFPKDQPVKMLDSENLTFRELVDKTIPKTAYHDYHIK